MPGNSPSVGSWTKRFVATWVAKEFETTRSAFRNTIKEIKEMAQEAGTWRASGVTGRPTSRSDSGPTAGAGATSAQKGSCGDAPSENDRLTRLAARIRCGLTLETTFEPTGNPKSDIRTMLLAGPELREALTPPQQSRRDWGEQVALLTRYVFRLGLALDNGCISGLDANNVIFGIDGRAARFEESDSSEAPGRAIDLGTPSIMCRLLSDDIVTIAPTDPEYTAALAVSFVRTLEALSRAGGETPQRLHFPCAESVGPAPQSARRSVFEQLGCTSRDSGIHIWMHECVAEALKAMGRELLILRDAEDPEAFRWALVAAAGAQPQMSDAASIAVVARKLADESRRRMEASLRSCEREAQAFGLPQRGMCGVASQAPIHQSADEGSRRPPPGAFHVPQEKRGFRARLRVMWVRVSGFVKETVVKPVIEWWRTLLSGKSSARSQR
ncbi:protein of unknown function [Pararobbsia alpina]